MRVLESERLLIKPVEEGVMRRHFHHDGAFHDVRIVGVLREEFLQREEE